MEEIVIDHAAALVQEEFHQTVESPPPQSMSMFSFSTAPKPKRLNEKEKELSKKAITAFVYTAHKVCCKNAKLAIIFLLYFLCSICYTPNNPIVFSDISLIRVRS